MTMQTGDVSRRIGIPITEELLRELGFKPIGTDKRARIWDEAEYPEMCERLGEHIKGKVDVPMQPRPAGKPKKNGAAPAQGTLPLGNGKPGKIKIDLDDEEL